MFSHCFFLCHQAVDLIEQLHPNRSKGWQIQTSNWSPTQFLPWNNYVTGCYDNAGPFAWKSPNLPGFKDHWDYPSWMAPIRDRACPDESVPLLDKDACSHPSTFSLLSCPDVLRWSYKPPVCCRATQNSDPVETFFDFHPPQLICDTLLLLHLPVYYLPSYYDISTFIDWQHGFFWIIIIMDNNACIWTA